LYASVYITEYIEEMQGVLSDYFAAGTIRRFSKGELMLDGSEKSGIFYIDNGFVKVYSISDQGNKYVHIVYKKGEIFPLIWAFKDIWRRVFYDALSDCTLLEIPKAKFLKSVKADPKLSYGVIMQLTEQFNIFADRLDNLQYKSAYERVVFRLLYLAGRFGVKKNGHTIINAPITHELIAESINMARESTSRQIEKLEKLGLVEYGNGQITIKDIKGLNEEFSEPVSLDLWGLS
jgi:CRP-like cAMP-binding protein